MSSRTPADLVDSIRRAARRYGDCRGKYTGKENRACLIAALALDTGRIHMGAPGIRYDDLTLQQFPFLSRIIVCPDRCGWSGTALEWLAHATDEHEYSKVQIAQIIEALLTKELA